MDKKPFTNSGEIVPRYTNQNWKLKKSLTRTAHSHEGAPSKQKWRPSAYISYQVLKNPTLMPRSASKNSIQGRDKTRVEIK